ncbi:MAG: antitoxin, partial [Actinomycetota bacterium]|nr:antitoxin [Actinomycetota bacterium]
DALMRATIDLPDDVHKAALLIVRDRHQALSRTVASVLRSALAGGRRQHTIEIDPESGLSTSSAGRQITVEDAAAVDDNG